MVFSSAEILHVSWNCNQTNALDAKEYVDDLVSYFGNNSIFLLQETQHFGEKVLLSDSLSLYHRHGAWTAIAIPRSMENLVTFW